jgi:hypothetical protein
MCGLWQWLPIDAFGKLRKRGLGGVGYVSRVKWVLVALLLPLLCVSVPSARAATGPVVFTIGSNIYTVAGQPYQMDAAPVMVPPGRTMVPVRYLALGMGIEPSGISWNPSTEQVTLSDGVVTETMTIGSYTLNINGNPFNMDVCPAIINGRTMLPARWVANNFGWTVAWRQRAQEVVISGE